MTLASKKLSKRETELLADLLMGAAYADDRLENEEQKAVVKILREMTSAQMLPVWLMNHLSRFDPKSFNAESTARELGVSGGQEAKILLGLLVRVTEADDVHDMDEGSYLLKVAKAVNAPADVIDNLTVEVLDEDIEEFEIEM